MILDLLNELLELVEIGAENLADLGAVVVGLEGGHGADAGSLGDLAEVVDVDLDEGDICELGRELLELGGNDLAGTNFSII